MRSLNYKETFQKLLTPEIVSYLAQIHEQKGQQNLFIEAHKDALTELLEIAKIQSTEASNRIEGIITTDDRLKKNRCSAPGCMRKSMNCSEGKPKPLSRRTTIPTWRE